ncbi:hypothetical protein MTO96_002598 [Rhipicephalus appendiculatus]
MRSECMIYTQEGCCRGPEPRPQLTPSPSFLPTTPCKVPLHGSTCHARPAVESTELARGDGGTRKSSISIDAVLKAAARGTGPPACFDNPPKYGTAVVAPAVLCFVRATAAIYTGDDLDPIDASFRNSQRLREYPTK